MEEIWKSIKGFNGNYQISNLGRIRSKKHRVGNYIRGGEKDEKYKILSPYLDKITGYERITLTKNYKSTLFLIHRLVATYFIPNPKRKKTVNHKNGIKTDNRVDNLEWCTYSENMKHSIDIGLRENCHWKNKFGSEHNTAKKIFQFDINGNLIKEWGSIIDAARELNIHSSSITHCAKGHQKTCGGFVWKYTND